MLIDTYGRVATDLRVSLTDRCNLRCTYCMPEQGLQWLAGPDLLTDDEIVRLIAIAVGQLGIQEVRFTGGEPLLRPGLVGIVERVAALRPRARLSLTTNGIGLEHTAAKLRAAGLDRVNVSLDTLRPEVFRTLTRRSRHQDVLEGIKAAREAGLSPLKVNAVLMPGLNDDEAPDLLAWAVENGYELRFIAQMPLDAQHGWKREGMITAGDILASLRTRFELTPEGDQERGSAPAERWLVDGGPHRVGVIASVTRPFCAACDRTRLTADGQLRTCLFAREETDLRAQLRCGSADEEIARIWRLSMWGKQAGSGLDDPFAIRRTPLSVDEVLQVVADEAAGGIALIVGTVRNHDGGADVSGLGYSCHPTAEAEMRRIAEKVAANHPVRALAAVHRVGELAVGDPAVVVAVACPHRGEAFAACRQLIDDLKHEVPIWKHQTFSDGSDEWVGA